VKPDRKPVDTVAVPSRDVLDPILGFKLRLSHKAAQEDWAASAREQGITLTQVQAGMVMLIGDNPGLTQVELAQLMQVETPTMSQALSPLVANGLIRRETRPSDRRARALVLTDAGNAMLDNLHRFQQVREARLCRNLSADERRELHRLLERVMATAQS